MSEKPKLPALRIVVETLDGYILSSYEITLNKAILRKDLTGIQLAQILMCAEEAAGNVVYDAFLEVLAMKEEP
jgi:hypothetical protein